MAQLDGEIKLCVCVCEGFFYKEDADLCKERGEREICLKFSVKY